MSAMLKQKLIDIANGFTKYGLWKGGTELTVDGDLSTTSENPVQNKVITESINTLNSNLIKTKEIAMDVTVAESSGVLGSYYGYFKIAIPSEIINTKIIAFIPISATSITSNGSCGILGLYNADSSSNDPTWAVSTPTSGTYRCRFIIIFI